MLSFASSALAAMALWVALLFHELAHAAAAEAVGVRIWGVRLGMGPTIWRGTVNGRQVHICALPFLGGVTLLDEDAGRHRLSRHRLRALALRVGPRGLARARSSRRPAASATSSACCFSSPRGKLRWSAGLRHLHR